MNTELLTINDLCKELDIGKNTACKLIRDKKIKSAKIGNKFLITRKNLNQYIESLME